jgi:ribosomal protein S18 acetylase RimI-like enzyme
MAFDRSKYKIVRAEVMKSNTRALRFYKNFGFNVFDDHYSEFSLLLTKATK